MRLVTCEYGGAAVPAVIQGNDVVPLDGAIREGRDMLSFIRAGRASLRPSSADSPIPLDPKKLLAPIPVPRKNIMCLGWNYFEHVQESAAVRGADAKRPEHPIVFTKNVTSVTGPYADIPSHRGVTDQLDWEVELGVVIGTGGRDISEADALEHVFGYTIINDISARDLQFRHKQFFLGKSLDGACPMGPFIVTADEIPNPQQLNLRSWVNGEVKQESSTREMVFSVARIIAVLSRGMTLEPGDIIATGTPSGVGFARTPPEFLKAGDIVECEIEGIGRIRNRVMD